MDQSEIPYLLISKCNYDIYYFPVNLLTPSIVVVYNFKIIHTYINYLKMNLW